MASKDEVALSKAELVDGTRTVVAYELRNRKRRLLNDVENDRVARFEAAVNEGADPRVVCAELLGETVDIRALSS